jgi:hypothetical protein
MITTLQRLESFLSKVGARPDRTLLIAAVLGGPLGVVAGRWGWRAFAGSLGVAPAPYLCWSPWE